METFFILFILVFALFLWYIESALHYTNETVGKDSPVYRERAYQFSVFQYFGNFLRISNPVLVVMMLVLVFVTGKAAVQQAPVLLIFPLFFLGFAGLFCFVIYFDWQYWKITRNVLITFNPAVHSITVDSPLQQAFLTPENVVSIEQHVKKPGNGKDPLGGYGYYLFYTANGQVTRINNIFFSHIGHFEFLERFFPNTPRTIIEHRLPWITDPDQTRNPVIPNFAA